MSYSKDVIFQILTPKVIRKGCLHACNTDLKTFKLATIVFVVDHTKKKSMYHQGSQGRKEGCRSYIHNT